MEIPLLLALCAALVLFYWSWIVSPRSIQAGREQLLREQGQKSGATFFPVDPRRMLGDWDGTCILLDPDVRIFCERAPKFLLRSAVTLGAWPHPREL